jgi:polar amino acid transport system substrate-binding protein
MKKILSLVMCLGLVFILASCSRINSNKLDRIKEKGIITIATNAPYPPYEFYDTRNGKQVLVGYDIDLANEITKELGVKIEWKDIAFDALIPSLASEQVDLVLAGLVPTEDRSKMVDFSTLYNQSGTVALAKKEKIDKVCNFNDLIGKKIVVQSGTTQLDQANMVKDAKILSLPLVSDTVTAITTGQADVLFISKVSANNIVASNSDLTYHELNGFDASKMIDGAAVGVAKGNKDVLDFVNKVIENLKNNGSLDKMFEENSKLWNEINN